LYSAQLYHAPNVFVIGKSYYFEDLIFLVATFTPYYA
jgi:hypothetical protein